MSKNINGEMFEATYKTYFYTNFNLNLCAYLYCMFTYIKNYISTKQNFLILFLIITTSVLNIHIF